MTRYDVFNGDADGLCALRQLRLAAPAETVLVSGPKRDIVLLERVPAGNGDEVTVLDVSLAANRAPLARLLEDGATVRYFDHHHAGPLPSHPRLDLHVDESPAMCTALIVDRWLGGAYSMWAVAAAFGDNLHRPARALAQRIALADAQTEALRTLGEALNYNGYGDDIDDLIVHPAVLYRTLERYADPLQFVAHEPVLATLVAGRREDLASARACVPVVAFAGGTVHVLPDTRWSRRVRGAFANDLANRAPQQAHAVITPGRRGAYTVSIRTPGPGADALCREFKNGGGRARAAGINELPADRLDAFVVRFQRAFAAR